MLRFAGTAVLALTLGAPALAHAKKGVTLLSPQVIIDREGFGKAVEAYSILVPKGWKFESNLAWFGGTRCGPGYAQPVFQMVSPDGRYSVSMNPGIKIELVDMQLDPRAAQNPSAQPYLQQQAQIQQQMAQAQRQLAGQPNCKVGRTEDIGTFVRQVMVPVLRSASKVSSITADPELEQAMSTLAQQMASQRQAMPGMVFDNKIETAKVTLDHPDGTSEIFRLALINTISAQAVQMIDINGMGNLENIGVIATTEQKTGWPISYRAPKAELQKFEKTALAIHASLRVNPVWNNAFNQFMANMNRINRQGAVNRSRILAKAASDVSDIQMNGWRKRQAITDRGAQQSIDVVRGVERRVDPNTGSVYEVPNNAGGYYSNGKGTIALVDDPGINPADVFPDETWTSMKKAR